jgi:cytochrome c553
MRTPAISNIAGRGRLMKRALLQIALAAAVSAIVLSPAVGAEQVVPKHELQAKIAYCETCHGSSGRGFHGYNPIPRLAGQQPEYLKNQLRAFVERGRSSNIMYNVSHVLTPPMLTALATNFSELDPKPLGGAPKELAAMGRKIFEAGIPESNIPACATCHGPDAKGNGPFPRLAGQLYDYLFNKLTNWSQERGQNPAKPDTSAIMEPIAHGLTAPEIRAVAAYVSDLE